MTSGRKRDEQLHPRVRSPDGRRVVKLWREGKFRSFAPCCRNYADCCYGEGNMRHGKYCWECWVGTNTTARWSSSPTCSRSGTGGERCFPLLRRGVMPHFIAECTENIREQADLPGLFSKVNRRWPPPGFSPSAVSAVAPTGWMHGRWLTVLYDYAFVHMTLKIGAGQHQEAVQEVGEMLFGLIKPSPTLMENRYLALSFARLPSCIRRSITNKTTYTRYLNTLLFRRWRADRRFRGDARSNTEP